MAELIFDTWQGLCFGDDGVTAAGSTFALTETPGLDDVTFEGGEIVGGPYGSAEALLTPGSRSWVSVVDIQAATAAAWDTKRDLLRAKTSAAVNILGGAPYVQTHRDTVRTIFARVMARQIPRDSVTVSNYFGTARIAFASVDPISYGPETTVTFTGASDSDTADSDGWVDSHRWKWTVPGPVTNPVLSNTLDASLVVRFVGTIPSGSNLVVETFPEGTTPGYYAKVVTDANLANYRTIGVGTNAYGNLDRGASYPGVPPRWFPVIPGEQTISYSASSGTAGSTFVWRPGFD